MSSAVPQSLPPASSAQSELKTRARASLHLLYHELSPEKSEYTYALATGSFEKHLQLFRRLSAEGSSTLKPEITFDDGHVSNFEYALPMLSAHEVVARFFITAGWTSQRAGYMTWEQLRELEQAGQEIGAHGWSHTLLTHCTEVELTHELSDARLLLEDKLGTPVTTLSLPGGRFNRRVLDACERAGYTQVFTSIPRAESSSSTPLMGRLNLHSDADVPWLERIFEPESPALRRLNRQYRLKEAMQRTLGDGLYAKLWALVNRPDPEAHLA